MLSPVQRVFLVSMPLSEAKRRSSAAVILPRANTSLPPLSSSQLRHTQSSAPESIIASSTRRSCAVKSVKPSTKTRVPAPIDERSICPASTLSRSEGSALPFATTPS